MAQPLHFIKMAHMAFDRFFHQNPSRWLWGRFRKKRLLRPSRLVSSAIGGKGRTVEPPQDDLVLYHPGARLRYLQNVLHVRLSRGYLVLYHFLVPPLLNVPVAPLEVSGILLAPPLLSLLLALLPACLVPAGLLPVSHSSVGHKIPTAIGTLLRQRRPPSQFLVRSPILNQFFSPRGIKNGKYQRLESASEGEPSPPFSVSFSPPLTFPKSWSSDLSFL